MRGAWEQTMKGEPERTNERARAKMQERGGGEEGGREGERARLTGDEPPPPQPPLPSPPCSSPSLSFFLQDPPPLPYRILPSHKRPRGRAGQGGPGPRGRRRPA